MSKNFSRRTFLKGTAASALSIAALGLGSVALAEEKAAEAAAAAPAEYTGEVPYLEQTVAQIAPNLYCISEFYLVNTYLLVGEERAILFDTGCGIGNIREIVERITDKPITVLLTHGHFDHSAGLYHFTDCDVYMHPADLNQSTGNNELRTMYASTRAEVRFPGPANLAGMLARIPAEEPEAYDLANTKPLKEGDVFDVGGSTVTVYETPGHTPGSVAFLVEPQRMLVSGDTLNNSVILARQPDNGTALIEEFNQTCRNLWKLSDKFDYLAVGHDGFAWEKNLIKDYIDLSQGLLDGYITGKYLEFGIRAGDMARLRTAELWYQCDK